MCSTNVVRIANECWDTGAVRTATSIKVIYRAVSTILGTGNYDIILHDYHYQVTVTVTLTMTRKFMRRNFLQYSNCKVHAFTKPVYQPSRFCAVCSITELKT